MTAVNQAFQAQTQDLPAGSASFAAAASLANAAAQFVPPSALATSLTQTPGVLFVEARTITKMRVVLTGDAANVAGQTISIQLNRSVGGAAYGAVAAAVITGIATTAGVKTGSVDFTSSPLQVAAGDILSPALTPSALLTAVVTNVMIAVS